MENLKEMRDHEVAEKENSEYHQFIENEQSI